MLTLSQMTNFRLFHTEKISDNFEFDENGRNVLQVGRKHSGKRKSCLS